MKKIFPFLALAFVFMTASCEQNDSGYVATLKTMNEVSGGQSAYIAVVKQMFATIRKSGSPRDEAMLNELERQMTETSMNELMEKLAPVYKKHLSQADLEEMIKFYKTPVGQKFARTAPLIAAESGQIAQQWVQETVQKISQAMKEKGMEMPGVGN